MGSEIPFISCTTGWEPCKVDGDFMHGDGQIEIDGIFYEKGLVAHAPGQATFWLDGLFDKFSSCIGISQLSSDGNCGVYSGDARFRVLGDSEVLKDWLVKSSPEPSTCFEVDVTIIDKLVLETDLNGSRDCDLSTWADAKVYQQGY